MPRIKDFEGDDYDPISAEVVRAASYAGRETASDNSSSVAADAPVRRTSPDSKQAKRPAAVSGASAATADRPTTAPASPGGTPQNAPPGAPPNGKPIAKRPLMSKKTAKRSSTKLIEGLTRERDAAQAKLASIEDDHRIELDTLSRRIAGLTGELERFRVLPHRVTALRAQLKWARIVSVGTTALLFGLALWMAFSG